jgi:hypothetical protein
MSLAVKLCRKLPYCFSHAAKLVTCLLLGFDSLTLHLQPDAAVLS